MVFTAPEKSSPKREWTHQSTITFHSDRFAALVSATGKRVFSEFRAPLDSRVKHSTVCARSDPDKSSPREEGAGTAAGNRGPRASISMTTNDDF